MSAYTFPSLQGDGLFLILGLGETGVAAANWCLRHGAGVRIADTRQAPSGLQALQQDADTLDLRLGDAACQPDVLEGVRAVVLSPGLAPNEAPVSDLLALARDAGIEIIGEIELFARALADLAAQDYQPALLAVTGTNGKTTVTAMTRQLLEAAGMTARAAGNISPAALAALADALDGDALPQAWVLELSSFQLETTTSLRPAAATVLNITQDHLDWHGSMQAYAAAKARILSAAQLAVVNRDDLTVVAMVPSLDALSVRSFGMDRPELAGDLGLENNADVLWLAAAQPQDFDLPTPAPRRRRRGEAAPVREQGRVARLMPVDALQVHGMHNALNAQAALLLAQAVQPGIGSMLRALRDYRGEPHRVSFVRSIGAVDFIDDSKGTNVGATVAALQGLGRPSVLIAGGLGKDQDFTPLARAVQAHARAVVLIGRDAPRIEQTLADDVQVEHADSMEDAVRRAHALARDGDAVLLSPACASMDMFRSYAHRAQAFVDAVQDLALDMGEV